MRGSCRGLPASSSRPGRSLWPARSVFTSKPSGGSPLWFKWFKRRRQAAASEPEQPGVYVGSIVGAQFASPSPEAREKAAVAEFDLLMAPGLRQPTGPVRRSTPFSSRPGRQGTGF